MSVAFIHLQKSNSVPRMHISPISIPKIKKFALKKSLDPDSSMKFLQGLEITQSLDERIGNHF